MAPPAGAVGRGDGFILSIAQKAKASILSNDSYQEFHGEYSWLFDEGRLIGGKPVPHVGWVFVNRVPVRGPVSRRSVKEQKIVDKSPSRRRNTKRDQESVSISADGPMPVPTSLPPGAVPPGSRRSAKSEDGRTEERNASGRESGKRDGGRHDRGRRDAGQQEPGKQEPGKQEPGKQEPGKQDQGKHDQGKQAAAAKTTNDLLSFLSFVEHFPVGSAVTGVVESYSSHGAYVLIGDVHGYVPLRLMADPAPRSAREAMELGETVTLVVSSFGAARRSIDLAVPSMAPVVVPSAPKTRRAAKQAAVAADIEAIAIAAATPEETAAAEPLAAKSAGGRKRGAKRSPAVEPAAAATAPAAPAADPTPASSARPAKAAPRAGAPKAVQPTVVSASTEVATVEPEPAPPPAAKKSPRRRSTASPAATQASAVEAPPAASPTHAPTPAKQPARRRAAAKRPAAS